MKNSEVRIQYIYHSGFIVETAQNILVFDYYRGTVKLNNAGNKKVFVFSSHEHADHFTPQIFEWQKERPDIHYILSSDICIRQRNDNIKLLSPYEETAIDNVNIRTFGSTDLGVSFLVNCDGIDVFHAGDLNWWYWWGESPEEIANAEKLFKEEIAKIKGLNIDLAFFPIDPRLEHNDRVGADYFIKEITPKVLIPMHFADNPATAEKYADSMKHSPTRIVALTKRGQEILLFG
ncbi:MAG: hydrolase [Firmicutes bacterium HGW-Firmicutes-12]|jgi:L-ascorbate metabolism protein UlaG (beta-lactamase superfamily)|nr:MAG: hydrolase [Firmicutes bacterium HGW-Firmicutes-12]